MQITAIARKKIAKSRPTVSLDAHPLKTPAQGHASSESHRICQRHCLHLDLQRIVQSQASTICSLQPLVFTLRGSGHAEMKGKFTHFARNVLMPREFTK